MNKVLFIRIQFSDFWLSGDGRGLGSEADARALRGDDGWPAMPMSQIKGTLRETSEFLERHGALPRNRTTELFGFRPSPVETDCSEASAAAAIELLDGREQAAALAFDDIATVPPWARDEGDPKRLFHIISSTARTSKGVAKDRTLRAIEAVAPTEIVGLVKATAGGNGPENWQEDLALICQWTRAFGKDKGNFGTAVATCHALDCSPAAATRSASDVPTGRATLWVTLTGSGDIRFTDRPQTEGLRRTLHHVPGSAFLGAAARFYQRFGADARKTFHLGGVRFGGAMPVAQSGFETVPVPASYATPKGKRAEAWQGGVLEPEFVVDGRPEEGADGERVRYAPIKARFMSTGFNSVETKTAIRSRTATREGRGEDGQLFTTEYLRTAGQTFLARIDVKEDVSVSSRRLLEEALSGELRLGSARSNSGGVFHSSVAWHTWREQEKVHLAAGKVRVLCVSDVCVLDAYGAPALTIPGTLLGLGKAKFIPEASVVSHRRYAKRNGHFKSMTDERLVIEAGSVLEYGLPEEVDVCPRQFVGRHQQDGLGSVWVNPPFLGAEITPANDATVPTLNSITPKTLLPAAEPSGVVVPTTPSPGAGGIRIYDVTLRATAPLATSSGRSLVLERTAFGYHNEAAQSEERSEEERTAASDSDQGNANVPKKTVITVDELLRDADGLPTIAPRSIRGALRAIAGRKGFDQTELKHFMGFVEKGDGARAGFRITWPKVVLGSGDSKRALEDLLRQDTPLLRDRVAINAAGVVDGRKKFTVNAVPKGTVFNFQMIAPLNTTNDGELFPNPLMEKLVSLMFDPEFRLGSSTTQGFGAVAVSVSYQDQSWADRRPGRDPEPFTPKEEPPETQTITRLGPYRLEATHFLAIGGGAEAPSHVPTMVQSIPTAELTSSAEPKFNVMALLRETTIKWQGDTPTLVDEFPLTGSALKGVLAHRALYYWNQKHRPPLDWMVATAEAEELFNELAARPEALTWLFGEAKNDDSGRQGGLFVEEVELVSDHVTRIDHVSIDRFTGGARDETGSLFAEEVLFRPRFDVTLTLRRPQGVDEVEWEKAIDCLLAAISDLREGRLAVGARGHGLLQDVKEEEAKPNG